MTKWQNLAVEGAVAFTPEIFVDARGTSVSPFQGPVVAAALGHRPFPVDRTLHSSSRRGVVRGAHFTRTPPGAAKYVYCARGGAIDLVIDVRVGSPTYGRWDSVVLDQEEFRAVYVPVGVAHAVIALEDDTVVSYLLSGEYFPENELAVSVFDAELDLPIPGGTEAVMSERDRAAPTLARAMADGVLPRYADCRAVERALHTG